MRCNLARAGSLPRLVALSAAIVFAAVPATAFVPGDGKGKADLDCLIGLDGIEPTDVTPLSRSAVQCTDCDAGCDRDGVASPNGACSFEVAVCLNRPDVPGCQPQELKKAKAGPKLLGLRVPETAGTDPACGEPTELIVPTRKNGRKPGKRKVRLVAKPQGKGKDKDTILFLCNPRPAGEACPAPITTTTTTLGGTTTSTTLPCRTTAVTFRTASTAGDAGNPATWPGDAEQRTLAPGCDVTIARPAGEVAASGDAFGVVGFTGYLRCYGLGGEDGDGCRATSCPAGGVGSCEGGRPTCSPASDGVAEATFRVRCDGSGVFPTSFVDNLLVKEQTGAWSRGEGLVASLGLLAGEVDEESVLLHPDLLNREATGIVAMAYDYLADDPDASAASEITRLLRGIVFSGAQLEEMAAEAPPPGAGGALGGTAEVDCAAFYAGHEIPPGVSTCLEQSVITVNGKPYRLFVPHPTLPAAGWTAEHHDWVREAVTHTVAVYDALGPAPPVGVPPTDIVLSVQDHGGFWAQATTDLDPCVVVLYASMQDETEGDFKQIVAHELGHCFQQATFAAQNAVPYETVKWREEGLAEYLSNWAYPDNNLEWGVAPEHRGALLALQRWELATTLLDRAYTNFLFFQYLANTIGNGGIILLVQSLPNGGGTSEQAAALAAYGDMATRYRDFAKAMTDRTIADTGGGMVPYEMTPDNRPTVTITGPTLIEEDFEAFSVSRYHLVVDNDHEADVTFTEQGDVREQSRTLHGLEWGDVPLVLPDRCSEVVLVATSTEAGASYVLDVPEVREEPAQCTLEGEWVVDNDSLNVMQVTFETDYVSGEIRGTFRTDGTVEVAYDDWEYRVSDMDELDVGGIVVTRYEEFTYVTNAQGVTTWRIDGDRIEFGDFFESGYLEGTETRRHVRTYDPPDTIGPDIDETIVRDPGGQDVFSGIPQYELTSTLRLIVPTREAILHRVGDAPEP